MDLPRKDTYYIPFLCCILSWLSMSGLIYPSGLYFIPSWMGTAFVRKQDCTLFHLSPEFLLGYPIACLLDFNSFFFFHFGVTILPLDRAFPYLFKDVQGRPVLLPSSDTHTPGSRLVVQTDLFFSFHLKIPSVSPFSVARVEGMHRDDAEHGRNNKN